MKTFLLGSTALIGAALVAQPAAAQLEVRVTGSVGFQAGYADVESELVGDIDGFDFQSESEIIIRADGVADNGLQYGAKVEILTSANDPFGDFDDSPSNPGNGDEVSLYVAGNWGKMEFGDFDGAADEMDVYAPTVGIGQVDGAFDDWAGGSQFLNVRDSGDGTKINYYTPEFAGFRFGIAYAPYASGGAADFCGDGENVCLDSDFLGEGIDDIVELGFNYGGDFGSTSFIISAVYTHSDDFGGVDGLNDWAVGAQVGFGGFTVGANYVSRDDIFDSWGYTIGATYTVGPWGFGANYIHNGDVALGPGGGDSVDTYGVGAVYTIAPGLTAAADIVGFDGHGPAGDDNGWVVVTEIKASF